MRSRRRAQLALSSSAPARRTDVEPGAPRLADRFAARPEDEALEVTLGERLALAWDGLATAGTAVCPVCHSRMDRFDGVGRCFSCGAELR